MLLTSEFFTSSLLVLPPDFFAAFLGADFFVAGAAGGVSFQRRIIAAVRVFDDRDFLCADGAGILHRLADELDAGVSCDHEFVSGSAVVFIRGAISG